MNDHYFFLLFLVTILATRIFLYIKPVASPTIKGFRIHHWMYGVILIILSFIVSSIALYAVGLGLFVDEFSYILIGGKTHKDNYSIKSLFGTLLFVILVYIFQTQIRSLLF
jgi:hypothetical protein